MQPSVGSTRPLDLVTVSMSLTYRLGRWLYASFLSRVCQQHNNMDNKVTIDSVDFTLTSQQPTGNVRSGLVGTAIARAITNHMSVSPKGSTPVTRTVRKIELDTSVTLTDGSVVVVPVSASLTVVLPKIAPVSSVDAPLSKLRAWMAQATFDSDIKTNAI